MDTMRSMALVLTGSIILLAGIGCSRPEKRVNIVYHNDYKAQQVLIVSSEHDQDEAWIEVREKAVETNLDKTDSISFVFRHDKLVGYILADGRTYVCMDRELPYEIEGKSNKLPVANYIGTFRTFELNVQKLLNLPYPITIK
jgi:hypothetical protein